MLALSLWRPWPWTFFHAGKRAENRSWPLPKWAIDRDIAIHAAQKFDQDALNKMRSFEFSEAACDVPATGHPTGIVGVFRFNEASFEYTHPDDSSLHGLGAPVASQPGDFDYNEPDPWAFGPYVWPVDDVRELPVPIPCRGYQKLWRLPADVECQVREQLARKSSGR